jgi:TldD protein
MTFASTDGAFFSQTIYRVSPSFSVGVVTPKGRAGRSSDLLQPRCGGFEVVSEARLVDELPRLVEEAFLMVEAERIMPDRYDVVVDARLMAQLVGLTIGTAAELDRVLGYEANAGGTSYLAPPAEMLGTFQLGPEFLNVRANRSRPGGLATVRWDEEGVEPEEYDVIKNGVLVDYHTTRELAGELSEWYGRTGRPVRSHGCAASESALSVNMLHPPNIEMLAGRESNSLDDLISGLKKGLVLCGGRVTVDRQQLNGEINAEMVYEVRDGKRTKFVHSAEALFRAPELWKSLKAIGGPGTEYWSGASIWKGQPVQQCHFGVGAVPGYFEKLAVTDRMRKA